MISNTIRQPTEDSSTRALVDRDTWNFSAHGGLRRRRRPAGGFTLIELLVVLGIIAAVAAGIGLALRGGDDTVALGSAQRTMASLLTATRAQAIMNGTNARLIVHNDPNDSERYLRVAGIVREQLDANGAPFSTRRWVPTSEGTRLPRGTYFVPPENDPQNPSDLFDGEWTTNDAYSDVGGTFQVQYPRTPTGQSYSQEGGPNSTEWFYYEFGPNGELSGGTTQQIVLSVGRRTPTTPVFENPDNVRGIVLRRIGTCHLVNERLTFHGTN